MTADTASCPHTVAETAQLAVARGGRTTGILDCPTCRRPCHVRDGNFPNHNCPGA